jgi:hypothetical protein
VLLDPFLDGGDVRAGLLATTGHLFRVVTNRGFGAPLLGKRALDERGIHLAIAHGRDVVEEREQGIDGHPVHRRPNDA